MISDTDQSSGTATLRAMVAMFDTGDLSTVDATVYRDYLDQQGLHREPITGRKGFALVVRTARCGFDSLDVTVEDLIDGSDRCAARLSWRGVRSSGELVERATIEIVRVEDGKAIEHWGAHS